MQINILWTGREYYSLENCRISTDNNDVTIQSTIIGQYGGDIYQVDYQIKVNANWETVLADIRFFKNNVHHKILVQGNGKGSWMLNGEVKPEFDGCLDIDLPLTPFTNTLPIRRLNMQIGEEQLIKVLYLDLLNDQFTAVTQKYVKLSDTIFHYENVPNDFEAEIVVDDNGLVVDYPGLFYRSFDRKN